MLPFAKNDAHTQKLLFSAGPLPRFIDPSQPPQKSKPFASLWELKWAHTVDMILPENADTAKDELLKKEYSLHYAKVIMSLSEIIDGAFFNEYIKKGNVAMLSEGRPNIDNLFSLYDGLLRLELDKPTYERTGLVGKAIPDGGLKHKRNRFAIEINLRLPPMLRGKKGFERVKWAFKNVLNISLTWLFYDLAPSAHDNDPAPIEKHRPLRITSGAESASLPGTLIPRSLRTDLAQSKLAELCEDREHVSELEEWIALVTMLSPRVQAADRIDSYLCRYRPPESENESGAVENAEQEVTRLSWHGYIPSQHLVKILIALLKAGRQNWSAVTVTGFRGECVTILSLPEKESGNTFLEWQHNSKV